MIPSNKTELISEIQKHFASLWKDLENFPKEFSDREELEWQVKNTKVSVNNLISYLIWWWEMILKWNKNFKNPEKLELPEKGFKWNELGKLAQKFYKDYEKYGFEELKALLQKNNSEILKMLKKHTNEELYEQTWYTKWTFWRLVQFNTSSPYKNIRTRIRKYIKTIL